MKKINVKKMFDFFVFLNLFTLCCDADNNFVFYFSLIGLIFTALIRGKNRKKNFFFRNEYVELFVWVICSTFGVMVYKLYRF